MVLCVGIDYAYIMYQKMYSLMRFGRFLSPGLLVLVLSACQSFAPYNHGADHCHGDDCAAGGFAHDHNHDHTSSPPRINSEGLVVGAVLNAGNGSALAAHERWRYADQLASHILDVNPQLRGNIDSYQYLSKRVGKPLGPILQGYRLSGELSEDALDALKAAQLRRRYLMLASISSREESLPLKPDLEPVVGPRNRDVHDYYELKRQTVLNTAVRVQVYDTYTGRKIHEDIISSHDDGRMLATENRSRKYVGNSVVAAISNTITNGLTGSSAAYPAPPKRDDVLARMWSNLAEKLPGEIFASAR